MPSVSIYLNFPGNAEEAFLHYQTVFGGEFDGGFMRFGEMPPDDTSMGTINEADKNKIMHVSLPILGGFNLMGTDITESMGMTITFGNNAYINLEPDTVEETDRLFAALSDGGKVEMPLENTFWGAYYGSCTDRFGVKWMFNCQLEK